MTLQPSRTSLRRSDSSARLAVVDPRRTVADALTIVLGEQPWVARATAHTSVRSLSALLAEEAVDAVVVDSSAAEATSLAVSKAMSPNQPAPRLLVVGTSGNPLDAAAALQRGATGWIPGDATFDELSVALQQVLRGAFWVPGRLFLELASRTEHGRESVLRRLTPRERDVLQGMVDGLTRPQIAERLGVSPHTVRTHAHGVLHKLSAHSSLRAVAIAREAGLVSTRVPRQRTARRLPG